MALLALSLDVHHERRSRAALTKVPAIKGLSYEDAEAKLRASNLNIRLLATRYDLPLQPGLIIDQVPQPGEEVVYGYPVGVTIAKPDSHGHGPSVNALTAGDSGSKTDLNESCSLLQLIHHPRESLPKAF